MKAVLQLSFIVFYLASSYAITQERTELQVERSQQAATGNSGSIDQACHECHFAFPHFRQATPKAGAVAYFSHMEAVHLIPHVATGSFPAQKVSFKSISSLENTLLRAPPIQL